MKYFLLVFFLLFTVVKAAEEEATDYTKLDISPNPVEQKEWRSSTIFQIIYYCVQFGGNIKDCSCVVDQYRAGYKENEFLKIRSRYLHHVQNKSDFSQDKELNKMLSILPNCK